MFFVVVALYSSILVFKMTTLGLVTTLYPYLVNMVGIVQLLEIE